MLIYDITRGGLSLFSSNFNLPQEKQKKIFVDSQFFIGDRTQHEKKKGL